VFSCFTAEGLVRGVEAGKLDGLACDGLMDGLVSDGDGLMDRFGCDGLMDEFGCDGLMDGFDCDDGSDSNAFMHSSSKSEARSSAFLLAHC
jgi:hypothetical protein